MSGSKPDAIRDPERLRALEASGILRENHPTLHRITRLARRILDVPVVQINVITEDRQIPVSWSGRSDFADTAPLAHSHCKTIVGTAAPFVVSDARNDERVREHPLTAAGAASYLGVPFSTREGEILGALCVIDFEPREWKSEDIRILEELAADVLELPLMDRRVREVTERSDALERSEAKFRLVTESIEGVFWIFDPDFRRAIYVSPQYQELWGHSLERVYRDSRAFLEGVHPEDRARVLGAMDGMREGEVDRLEFRVVQPDGRTLWAESRGFPVRDEKGKTTRVVGFTHDITERKRSEARNRQLAAAIESLSEGICIARLDGTVIFSNSAHVQLFGYDPEGEPPALEDFVAEGDAEVWSASVETALREGTWQGRLTLQPLDGSEAIPMAIMLGSVRGALDEALLFCVTRDIREELQRETQLRRAERLASIGTLIGGVAHELNNPLHAIQSFAELLLDEVNSESARADLVTISREAVRAAKIVSDLRMLARGTQQEAGERSRVDLNDVVRHVLNTRRYHLEARNVELREDLTRAPVVVMAEKGQLEQVVLNLVVNAEQAMEEMERDSLLIIRTRPNDSGVSLHVIDNGPGIPGEHLERIFDPFWTTKEPGEGTGLGLSLVLSIVTEHSGTVHVDSEIGKGTAFRIELPTVSEESEGPAPEKRFAPAARPLRVLIVDDEETIRSVFHRYLERRGHQVEEAERGEEALETILAAHAAGEDFDVIVSDLRMPGMGGDELFRTLRDEGSGLQHRMLFMTGDAVGGDAARILATLEAPVIYKPIGLAEAAAEIERHAERRR